MRTMPAPLPAPHHRARRRPRARSPCCWRPARCSCSRRAAPSRTRSRRLRTKPFTVVLDFFPNADHAALYSAIAHGDFRAVGLDVKPQTPADPSEPLKLLAAGKADMAISYEPELLLARDEGLKLVSIGALVQRPLTSIIALPQGHVQQGGGPRRQDRRHGRHPLPGGRAEDGRAVGRRRPGEREGSQRRLQPRAGDALEQSRGDARRLLELRGDPAAAAAQAPAGDPGRQGRRADVQRARARRARRRGAHARRRTCARSCRRSRAASTRSAPTRPAAAALVVKANPSLEQKLQLASIEQTLPAAVPSAGKPFGWQTPSAWASFGRWMFDHALLKHNPNSALPPFTNEFLPGQGI